MKYPEIESFKQNDLYHEEIFPDVYLMDNHKWAYYIWEKYFSETDVSVPTVLFHLDYHWDGINDFHQPDRIHKLKTAVVSDIYDFVLKNIVRLDSFIVPALIRNLIDEVHFYCIQKDTDPGIDNPGIDNPLLSKYGVTQFIHQSVNSIDISDIRKPIIFDIDLDLFNNSEIMDEGDLWRESEIIKFVRGCSGIIKRASLITIAMSFGYSGTDDNTKYLTKLFISLLKEIKELG